MQQFALATVIFLALITAGCPDDPTMLAKSGDPCATGAYLTLTGTIDEVENTVIDLLAVNADSTDSMATRDERMHIDIDLRTIRQNHRAGETRASTVPRRFES